MNPRAATTEEAFQKAYGEKPLLVTSPGRVNLIGEHTDYNEGFVLPAAIDKLILLALAPNRLNKIRLTALDAISPRFEADVSTALKRSPLGWPNYILGCVDQLTRSGRDIAGFDCLFSGDIPIGAGLSSSAALETGVLFGISELFGLNLSKMEIVRLAQQAENEFVGVECGIMDQFACVYGEAESVIRLDCRSLEHSIYPFAQKEVTILLCDTLVRRELAGSEYNLRRSQCRQGVEQIRQTHPEIESLRDLTPTILEAAREKLDQVIYSRCRYVLEENLRVLAACEDLRQENLDSFGRRMFESHTGLRDLYEVSCSELDTLVEAAADMEGVLGSRMMGGGFGGCTINLVKNDHLDEVAGKLTAHYRRETGKEPGIHIATIGSGTRRVH